MARTLGRAGLIGTPLQAVPSADLDLIVIGGGIHGAALLDEATRRGLRGVLLERGDFGQGASGHSLRILHGGLRYLQSMDLYRFRQSVKARRWYARRYPHLVRLLPCAMPLYGRGAQRRPVMRMALALNDLLSADRNRDVTPPLHMPRAGTCGADEMRRLWPQVPLRGLEGGALWYDYMMRSSERIVIETLQAAVARGSMACNRVSAEALRIAAGRVTGVLARDDAGNERELHAPLVINCTGGWARELARSADRDLAAVFRPSLAFNLLLDRQLPVTSALAVAPVTRGKPVYFVIPQGRTVLAGTVHRPRPEGTLEAVPTDEEIDDFLADLNDALPGLGADRHCVRRVFAGLLPVVEQGGVALTKREVIHDHGAFGGPKGLHTVTGIKFTTSRAVATAALDRMGVRAGPAQSPADEGGGPAAPSAPLLLDAEAFMAAPDAEAAGLIEYLLREEAARDADDIIYRRTNWSTTSRDLGPLRERVAGHLAGQLTGQGRAM